VKTKETHKRPARVVPDKKVSASRRQSAPLKGRSNVLTDDADVDTLVRDLGEMIETARRQVAVAANVSPTTLYWQVGHRVRTEALDQRGAEYGARIVAALGPSIGDPLWARFRREVSTPPDPLRGGFPGCGNCLRATETIVVESLQAAHLHP
jgi:hypothetical protein